jgi:hypothetical protein
VLSPSRVAVRRTIGGRTDPAAVRRTNVSYPLIMHLIHNNSGLKRKREFLGLSKYREAALEELRA